MGINCMRKILEAVDTLNIDLEKEAKYVHDRLVKQLNKVCNDCVEEEYYVVRTENQLGYEIVIVCTKYVVTRERIRQFVEMLGKNREILLDGADVKVIMGIERKTKKCNYKISVFW